MFCWRLRSIVCLPKSNCYPWNDGWWKCLWAADHQSPFNPLQAWRPLRVLQHCNQARDRLWISLLATKQPQAVKPTASISYQTWSDRRLGSPGARFWQQAMFKYLRAAPKDHHVLLREMPRNAPENREQTVEIMFEGLNIQSILYKSPSILCHFYRQLMTLHRTLHCR